MSVRNSYTLLSNVAATGAGIPVNQGGKYVFAADATFGGGTVKLQLQLPTGTWVDVASSSLTAAGISVGLDLPPGQYRGNVATATAVSAYLFPVV